MWSGKLLALAASVLLCCSSRCVSADPLPQVSVQIPSCLIFDGCFLRQSGLHSGKSLYERYDDAEDAAGCAFVSMHAPSRHFQRRGGSKQWPEVLMHEVLQTYCL